MTNSNVILNSGNFFVEDFKEKLAEQHLYTPQSIALSFEHLSEHFEKHHSHLNDEATTEQVGFFFANNAMHILGYTHSHNEPLPDDENTHLDYTLFDSPDAFTANLHARGTAAFFNEAVATAKVLAWSADLDNAMVNIGEEDEENKSPKQEHVLYRIDEWMRQTNLQWAILTNGRLWRLFHKNTVSMLTAFIQFDLLQIIQTKNLEQFTLFMNAFGANAVSDNAGTAPNRMLLA